MPEQYPHYLAKAIELGLLAETDTGLAVVQPAIPAKALEVARIVDKLQPTSVQEREDTTPQEAIVLSRILTSPSGLARQLWADLRSAFGVAQEKPVPGNLWSDWRFRAIAHEVDMTYIGQGNTTVISRDSLVKAYELRSDVSRLVPVLEFNQAIRELSDPELMASYGDASVEWAAALDVLRQCRVRALYSETLHVAKQNLKSDAKLDQALEFLQERSMECLGMLRGTIGSQGQAIDMVESIIGAPGPNMKNWVDHLMTPQPQTRPVSTGIYAMDIDVGGGIMPPSPSIPYEGRMHVLAARTGTGKTALSVQVAGSLALGGLTVGYISAELGRRAIEARLFASMIRNTLGVNGTHWTGSSNGLGYVTVMEFLYPDEARRPGLANLVAALAGELQKSGGRLLVEAPWIPCARTVVNSMRSMKARHPELRAVVVDHFHILRRHKGAPSGTPDMLEDRGNLIWEAAKELGVDVFMAAQMNRLNIKAQSSQTSEEDPPEQDQVRGTDALSHMAHALWLVRLRRRVDGEPSENRIELWHSKARESQVIWDADDSGAPKIQPITAGFVKRSLLQVDYSTCTIKSDDTMANPSILKAKGLLT